MLQEPSIQKLIQRTGFLFAGQREKYAVVDEYFLCGGSKNDSIKMTDKGREFITKRKDTIFCHSDIEEKLQR